jgi:hypothetical protein
MPKFIIVVNGEGIEVFEGTESEAGNRAYECWLEAADQDYYAVPYSKGKAEEYGLDEEE